MVVFLDVKKKCLQKISKNFSQINFLPTSQVNFEDVGDGEEMEVPFPKRSHCRYKDEVRGEMPHDEGTTSRQTSGWREGELHSPDLKYSKLDHLFGCFAL